MSESLLTTGEVARWLALSEEWVREHAAELGAVKVGDDPRAPLRFGRREVAEWLNRRRLPPPVVARPRRPSRERVELLPLPGAER